MFVVLAQGTAANLWLNLAGYKLDCKCNDYLDQRTNLLVALNQPFAF